ncbi:MAG: tRNA pseudouridine synthase B (EC, partial [uncultured Sulfurovum sp.]
RAYDLARAGEEVKLKEITSTIYDIKLMNYNHPFVHFKATVSEGTYIRSLGAIISDKLKVDGTLSSLKRLHEGAFFYDEEKALDPLKFLKIPQNIYTGDPEFLELGKKLYIEYFESKEDGEYWVETEDFFSVIEILDGEIKYKLNRVHKYVG